MSLLALWLVQRKHELTYVTETISPDENASALTLALNVNKKLHVWLVVQLNCVTACVVLWLMC